jgi:hypothetical protein
MRKVLRKILEILDGTPAVYGKQKGWNGQSVVELSLVTPILIVLLMGLAEIGCQQFSDLVGSHSCRCALWHDSDW